MLTHRLTDGEGGSKCTHTQSKHKETRVARCSCEERRQLIIRRRKEGREAAVTRRQRSVRACVCQQFLMPLMKNLTSVAANTQPRSLPPVPPSLFLLSTLAAAFSDASSN